MDRLIQRHRRRQRIATVAIPLLIGVAVGVCGNLVAWGVQDGDTRLAVEAGVLAVLLLAVWCLRMFWER